MSHNMLTIWDCDVFRRTYGIALGLDQQRVPVDAIESPPSVVVARRGEHASVHVLQPGESLALDDETRGSASGRVRVRSSPAGQVEVVWDFSDATRALREALPEAEGRVSLEPGEEIQLAELRLAAMPWRHADQLARRRQVLGHARFMERVREELQRRRAGAWDASLVLIQLRQVRRRTETLHQLLRLRPGDLVGSFAPTVLEIFLPSAAPDQALRVIERVLGPGRVSAMVAAGVPGDGMDGDTLLATALRRLRGPSGASERSMPFVATDTRFQSMVTEAERSAASGRGCVLLGEHGSGKSAVVRAVSRRVIGEEVRVVEVQPPAPLNVLLEALESDQDFVVAISEPQRLPLALQAELARRLSLSTAPAWVVFCLSESVERLASRRLLDPECIALLNAFAHLEVPPLRERPMDVVPLAMARLDALEPGASNRLSVAAMAHLAALPWPGNVAQLHATMERALRLASQGTLQPEHLPREDERSATGETESTSQLKQHVDSLERSTIERAMVESNYNQTHAAKRLGISRRALIYKLEKYGLKAPPGSIRPSRRRSVRRSRRPAAAKIGA